MPYFGTSQKLPATLIDTATKALNRLSRLRPLIRITVSDGPNSDETSMANDSHTSVGPAATYSGPKTRRSGVEKNKMMR